MAGIHPRITKQFRPELAQKVTDLTCARPRFFPHSIFGYAESEPPRPQSSDPTSKFGNHPQPRPSLHIGGARPRPEYSDFAGGRITGDGAVAIADAW